MQVNLYLQVKADEFFNLLIGSVVHDIQQVSNKKITPEDITSGYTYEKYLTNKLGKKGRSTVQLTSVERPYHYKAIFNTSRGINTLSYTIEEVNDGTISVIYDEQYQAINKSNHVNFNFMRLFYNRKAKKRSISLLRQMEAYIIKQ